MRFPIFLVLTKNSTSSQTGTLTINAVEGEVLDIGLVNANNGIRSKLDFKSGASS